jgi:hypothetical protein
MTGKRKRQRTGGSWIFPSGSEEEDDDEENIHAPSESDREPDEEEQEEEEQVEEEEVEQDDGASAAAAEDDEAQLSPPAPRKLADAGTGSALPLRRNSECALPRAAHPLRVCVRLRVYASLTCRPRQH